MVDLSKFNILEGLMNQARAGIASLKDYNRTQRLFYYSVLITLFLVAYFIVLPRYDCAQGVAAACEFIERGYMEQ